MLQLLPLPYIPFIEKIILKMVKLLYITKLLPEDHNNNTCSD